LSKSLCKHGRTICSQCVVVTDAAKRISDAIRLAVCFHPWEEISTGWMAFALADGTTDHVVYPSKSEAIRHMSDEFRYCYVHLAGCASGMPPKDAQLWLELHREAYDSGLRLAEPKAPTLIFPLARNSGPWPN
jgi:hypothetical protein